MSQERAGRPIKPKDFVRVEAPDVQIPVRSPGHPRGAVQTAVCRLRDKSSEAGQPDVALNDRRVLDRHTDVVVQDRRPAASDTPPRGRSG